MSHWTRQGEVLRKLRTARGESQGSVAKVLGVPRTSYCQMENGKRKHKALELAALCEHWGLSPNDVFVKG